MADNAKASVSGFIFFPPLSQITRSFSFSIYLSFSYLTRCVKGGRRKNGSEQKDRARGFLVFLSHLYIPCPCSIDMITGIKYEFITEG
jgi:hypothetical protein